MAAAVHTAKLAQVTAVLGTQWGDEGKGKIVDIISQTFDICARFNGGSNAGHSIVVDNVKYAFHLLPSGILSPKVHCIIGNGCVVHLPTLFHELEQLEKNGVQFAGRLWISDRAHLVFDFHQKIDGMNEDELSSTGEKLGTTRRGIGPAYIEKMNRSGIRVGDLGTPEFAAKLSKMVKRAQMRFKFEYDVLAEIKRYEDYSRILAPFIVDGV